MHMRFHLLFVACLNSLLFNLANAETVQFAAFTGYEYCRQVPQAATGEMCSYSLDFKLSPNNEIDLKPDEDGVLTGILKRDDSQNGLIITTLIQVKKFGFNYEVTLMSVKDNKVDRAPSLPTSADRFDNMERTAKYGATFRDPNVSAPDIYFKPFVYVSKPWESEPIPASVP